MEFLVKITKIIVDYSVEPIARQVGYLVFHKNNFKDLKDQIEELKRMKEIVQHVVEIERRNGREIDHVMENWLEKVDEITEAVKQFGGDPRHKNAKCSKWSCPNLKSRCQLSRNAKKMARKVVEVMKEKEKFDGVGYFPLQQVVGSTSATSSEKLGSRMILKRDIVLALRDPKIKRIGVYGLGGVGKTTLVKEVGKQVYDDKLFDIVVMVNISQAPDLKIIQAKIAEFLGLYIEEESIIERASRLCQRIKKEKSILFILVDIWEKA